MRRFFKAIENYEGDDWLLAYGTDADGSDYFLTTHFVHASEAYAVSKGAKEDCALSASLLNWYYNDEQAAEIISAFIKRLDESELT